MENLAGEKTIAVGEVESCCYLDKNVAASVSGNQEVRFGC